MKLKLKHTHKNKILFFFVISFCSMSLHAEQDIKQTLCELKSTLGDVAATYYKNKDLGYSKQQATQSMELHEHEVGSLNYEVTKMALDQAYAGTPATEITKSIMQFCMQQPFDAVDEPDVPISEFSQNP